MQAAHSPYLTPSSALHPAARGIADSDSPEAASLTPTVGLGPSETRPGRLPALIAYHFTPHCCHLCPSPELGPAPEASSLPFECSYLRYPRDLLSLFRCQLLLLFPSASLHSTYYLKSYPRYLSAYMFMSLSLPIECQLQSSMNGTYCVVQCTPVCCVYLCESRDAPMPLCTL